MPRKSTTPPQAKPKVPTKAKKRAKAGRPSAYTPALLKKICQELAKGTPLVEVCRRPGFPCDETVRNWEDRPEDGPAISLAIARAREEGEDAILRGGLKILEKPPRMISTAYGRKVDPGDVAWKKACFDGRLRLAEKFNPRRFGALVKLADADGDKLPPLPQFVIMPTAPIGYEDPGETEDEAEETAGE